MMNPEDARLIGGVPLDHVGGPPRELIQLRQPDGQVVMVTFEQATLIILGEVRDAVCGLRDHLVGPIEVIAEAEQATGGTTDGTNEE